MVNDISNLNINKIYYIRTDFALNVERINPSYFPQCKYFTHYTPLIGLKCIKDIHPLKLKSVLMLKNVVYPKIWPRTAVTTLGELKCIDSLSEIGRGNMIFFAIPLWMDTFAMFHLLGANKMRL